MRRQILEIHRNHLFISNSIGYKSQDQFRQGKNLAIDQIVIYKQFEYLSTVLINLVQGKMALSLNKRRSVNNLQVLQQIQNNSLVYFKNCSKYSLQDCPFFPSKQLRLIRSTSPKYQKTFISINGQTPQWNKNPILQNEARNLKDYNQNKFYSIFMERPVHLGCNDVTFDSEQNKENQINFSNQTRLIYSSQPQVQQCAKIQKIEKLLNQKIMKNYSRVMSNMKKLDIAERQIHINESSEGMKKIHMIEKLIEMLETNKNMRIREMFEERQRLSENQEEQKKLYQRKIEKVKEVEEKFKNRKIDEFTAIHELNGIHG